MHSFLTTKSILKWTAFIKMQTQCSEICNFWCQIHTVHKPWEDSAYLFFQRFKLTCGSLENIFKLCCVVALQCIWLNFNKYSWYCLDIYVVSFHIQMTLTEQGHKHSSRNYFRILLKQNIKRQHKLFLKKRYLSCYTGYSTYFKKLSSRRSCVITAWDHSAFNLFTPKLIYHFEQSTM